MAAVALACSGGDDGPGDPAGRGGSGASAGATSSQSGAGRSGQDGRSGQGGRNNPDGRSGQGGRSDSGGSGGRRADSGRGGSGGDEGEAGAGGSGGSRATPDDDYSIPDGPRFYVATGGDDSGDGSEQNPWRTIQHALDSVSAGNVIVREGRYAERLVIEHAGDGPDDYLTLIAEPGASVELSGSGANGGEEGNMVYLEGAAFVRVIGFRIVGAGQVEDASGVRLYGSGHHIEISHNDISEIRGESAMGITVYGQDGAGFSEIVIAHNQVHDCDPAPSEALVVNGNVRDFEIAYNTVADVNNIGIDVIGGESWLSSEFPTRGFIRGNRVERANSSYDGSAGCIYVDGASELLIEDNRVSECDFGIEIGAENADVVARDIVVRNNFVFRNYKGGIIFGGYDQNRGRVRNAVFAHNSLYQNGRPDDETAEGFSGEANGELIVQYADDCTIANNVFYGIRGSDELVAEWGASSGLTFSHNLYYAPGGGAEHPDDPGAVTEDPEFVDPANGDLHVGEGSPVEGAGTGIEEAGAYDIDGDARDEAAPAIGADER